MALSIDFYTMLHADRQRARELANIGQHARRVVEQSGDPSGYLLLELLHRLF